ncbi:FadR family transcriptional regulator OS=Streptomyces microflavus OX=1919 GN=G3I39_21640 PE=4 SV=1 [Streptomyces microflavus]
MAAVDLEDTLRFREVLETGAAGLCADGLPAEGEAGSRAALEATQGARLEDYRRQDTLLHLTLAELSGSTSD